MKKDTSLMTLRFIYTKKRRLHHEYDRRFLEEMVIHAGESARSIRRSFRQTIATKHYFFCVLGEEGTYLLPPFFPAARASSEVNSWAVPFS